MIVLPVYAVFIWIVIAYFRRRWQAFAILTLSVLPVMGITDLCVRFIPLPPGEPRPLWLYAISASYAVLIIVIGLVIALQHHARQHHHCHACGYDLTGSNARQCPECGAAARCLKCHRTLHDADRRCPVCATLAPVYEAQARETALPRHPREDASVLAARYARRLRALSSEVGHPHGDAEAQQSETDRAPDLHRVG